LADTLCSVGLDVGTTTTQLIVSELTVENQASGFAVPQMQIVERTVRFRGPVHFTPLLDEQRVDADAIARLVSQDYQAAGITPKDVDTGAIIITGETSRKENAAAVVAALSQQAGDFVVATAGPDLESVLAAKGAGAVAYSEATGKTVLHMDIGGGTSNLCLIRAGQILRTGCFNVGGRLLRFSKGKVDYVSPVLYGNTHLRPGDREDPQEVTRIAKLLAQVLAMAAGLCPATELLKAFATQEVLDPWQIPEEVPVISFSGGVADCIETSHPANAFGDIGPQLGQAIGGSILCQGEYILGKETIRATVIGAGCHSAQLSGSTIFCRGTKLPVKNLPVATFTREEQQQPQLPRLIAQRIAQKDSPAVVLALPGYANASYAQVQQLAEKILEGVGDRDIYVCLEADMAKALGQSLCLQQQKLGPCLCIDRVRLSPQSYLDVGTPVGPALPVVVKTLVLEAQE